MAAKRFKPGDHVSWNSEAGVVRGRITRIVTSPTKFKRYTVHGSSDEPQYEINGARRLMTFRLRGAITMLPWCPDQDVRSWEASATARKPSWVIRHAPPSAGLPNVGAYGSAKPSARRSMSAS